MDYTIDFMKEILNIPSVGGNTSICIKRIEDEFKAMGLEVNRTKKNALIVTIKGKNDEQQKLIAGHVDTLGGVVKEIKKNGRLRLAQVGGFSWNSLEGENVKVHTVDGKIYSGSILPVKSSIHIYSEEVKILQRSDENMEVRLDEFTKSKEDTLDLGIRVGDFVSFEPRCIITENGYIKSRHIDDKSAVAIIIGMCKYIVENNIKPKFTVHFIISNYEELGHGVSVVPEKTDEFIAIDIGTVGPNQISEETTVCICAKDSRTPYDFELRKKLIETCEEWKIDYRVDVYNRYGSDASLSVMQGVDVNFACVGPGVDATHHYERSHIQGIENTMKLLMKYIITDDFNM